MSDVTVTRATPQGMVTLKLPPGDVAWGPALAALGLSVPAVRRLERAGDRAALWMAPDEVLLLVPDPAAALAALAGPLAGAHHLAADVGAARVVFAVAGPRAREVLAKLCPVDLHPAAFPAGSARRTRAAQVACMLWAEAADDLRLSCFRSVEGYVADLLTLSADPAGSVGLFRA